MKNNLKLDNIKVVIFDFDGTLAIHRDKNFVKHRNESKEKRLKYYSIYSIQVTAVSSY